MKNHFPNMKKLLTLISLMCAMLVPTYAAPTEPQQQADKNAEQPDRKEKNTVKKVLFIGDSMTGWLSEALNGYGKENGFEVATVVWDGSTMQKWANSPKLKQLIDDQDPDAVFISLGMNSLFDPKPAHLAPYVTKIKQAVGDRGLVWVGPPSWPGQKKGTVLTDWLADQLGSRHFFNSFNLQLPRQSARNPHPTRDGMIKWVDALVEWLPNSDLEFPGLKKPSGQRLVRGKTFIYKRMKETL